MFKGKTVSFLKCKAMLHNRNANLVSKLQKSNVASRFYSMAPEASQFVLTPATPEEAKQRIKLQRQKFEELRKKMQAEHGQAETPDIIEKLANSASASSPKDIASLVENPATPLSKPFNLIPLPTLQHVTPILHLQDDDGVKCTTLKNKLRIASVDNHSKLAVITVLFECGIRYETAEEQGLSILLNKLSFKSSSKFSDEQLRNMHDKMMYESTTDQETMQYSVEFYRQHLPNVLEMMADTILQPQLLQEDIEEAIGSLHLSYEDQMSNPASSSVLTDSIMEACYGLQCGLGRPSLFITPNASRDAILKFMKKYYRPERCVITGVGINHEELVELVEKHFQFDKSNDEENSSSVILNTFERLNNGKVLKPQFVGGEKRVYYTEQPTEYMRQNLPALTAAVVAFEGVSIYDTDIFPIHVLETALGGGDSFSSGGPGKGIMSIINRNFLGYFEFWNMMCQHNAFTDTGVFCIHASAMHHMADRLLLGINQCYAKMLDLLKEEDLARAKQRFKSILLSNMEGNLGLSQKIAGDIMFINRFRGTNYMCQSIDKVKLEDIHRVVLRMMNSTRNPALIAIGDTAQVQQKAEEDNIAEMIKAMYNTRYAKVAKKQ